MDVTRLPPLPRRFYQRDAVRVARELIGHVVVHETAEGRVAGRIVECEAYDQSEPASHSHRGLTERTRVMFGDGGYAYVYFSYGAHWMLNVSTGHAGHGAAVLLRALEPLEGVELMQARRRTEVLRALARGPGCLARALGIDRRHYGLDMTVSALRILDGGRRRSLGGRIVATPRIGISKAVELPWRFAVAGSPFVSGPRTAPKPEHRT